MAETDYKRGEMDAVQATKTFGFVMRLTSWGMGVAAFLTIWAAMALRDQPVTGFFVGFVTIFVIKFILETFFKEE
ncbi:MAG: hypothetical protein AAGC95_03625 [Pseudomonadota bacterium]